MYNCSRHKALYRSSDSVLPMHVMLLIMFPILAAGRLCHPQTNPNLSSFDLIHSVSCNESICLTMIFPCELPAASGVVSGVVGSLSIV